MHRPWGVVVGAFDLNVRHNNRSASALERFAAMVDFGLAKTLLVLVGAAVATSVNAGKETLEVCGLRQFGIPNLICNGGEFAPAVGSIVKTVVTSNRCEVVVPNVVGDSGQGFPSVSAGGVPRERIPSLVRGKALKSVGPGWVCEGWNGKLRGGSSREMGGSRGQQSVS